MSYTDEIEKRGAGKALNKTLSQIEKLFGELLNIDVNKTGYPRHDMDKTLKQLKGKVLETIKETAEEKAVNWYKLGLYRGMRLLKENIKKGNIKVIYKNKRILFTSKDKDIMWKPTRMSLNIKGELLTIQNIFKLSLPKIGIKIEK